MKRMGALALAAALLGSAAVPAAGNELTVKTLAGKVKGTAVENGNVRAWLGIPYAQPPLADRRWKPPLGAKQWHGTRHADHFGARCEQGTSFPDLAFRDAGPSEDCLTLNVWAPAAANARSRLPVMVWIHGGGFAAGGSSEPRQDGSRLAARGVLVVSMNYRLGVFGFLVLPELSAEAGGAAGNYGLMDQVAALEWVRDNIARFGGDPEQVTIFGESAGSISVSALMASARARGLFARAIGESGGAFGGGIRFEPRLDRERADGALLAAAGVSNLAQLRALDAATLGRAAVATHLWFLPDIDGSLLPQPVSEIYAQGRAARVPLLAGWNRDEATAPEGMTLDAWQARVHALYGPDAEAVLGAYPAADDAAAARAAGQLAGDTFIAYSTWRWIEAAAGPGPQPGSEPVFRYRFEQPAPKSRFHPGGLAFHSDDIEYVFGTLDSRPDSAWSEADRSLSQTMMTYWTNFARSGDPNGGGLPRWPAYLPGWMVMHLGEKTEARPDTDRERYLLLDRVGLRQAAAR